MRALSAGPSAGVNPKTTKTTKCPLTHPSPEYYMKYPPPQVQLLCLLGARRVVLTGFGWGEGAKL